MTYVDGFVLAVKTARKDDYRAMALEAWEMFRDRGALSMMEAWGDDVPEGTLTSFRLAVKQEADETAVFSWILWPSKEVRDAAYAKMEADEAMKMPDDPPMDPKRMFWGGFAPLVDVSA